MGDASRIDAYSYHSESGMASGTPGGESESVRDKNTSLCPECNERKAGVVERSGDFSGKKMCGDCLQKKQEEKEKEEARSVLEKIRNADSDS